MPFDKADIYVCSLSVGEFWQGEILSGIVEVQWRGPENEVELFEHPLAIICSADCDLTQDHDSRASDPRTTERRLRNVLCCDVLEAEALKEASRKSLNAKIWSNVQQNKHERYHFLAEVVSRRDLQGVGFSPLAVDFKNFFCVSMPHLLRQLEQGGSAQRRCRLSPPFAQHLSQRFFYYQNRIGLPIEHHP